MFMYPIQPMQNRLDLESARKASQQSLNNRTEIMEMAEQVERLSLLNQAMWELLSEKLGLTDADLEKHAYVVDMRDGQGDGKITRTPVKCPSCSRVNSSHHAQCMYCGTLFQKMLFE